MDLKRNAIDPRNGFNSETKTFHSLRPPVDLPPADTPLSAAEFTLSLLHQRGRDSPPPDSVALVDSATGQRVLYSEFTRRTENLAANLRLLPSPSSVGLSKNDVAFVLSPNSTRVPILYLALLSIGVVVSPANPIATYSEIAAMIELCRPKIAFATSVTARKVKKLVKNTVVIDSPEFETMTTTVLSDHSLFSPEPVRVNQYDTAAIMYSSGTTGTVKGVMTTHRNLIAAVAGSHANVPVAAPGAEVLLYTIPYFHVYGFFYCLKSVAAGETAVVMERFEMRRMLRAVEEYKVTTAALVPPIVVAMAKGDFTAEYDLSSLEQVGCGGAPLGKDVIEAFAAKFRDVALLQGYGLTESTGVAFRMISPEESLRRGSAGKLNENFEAKIVDMVTGDSLLPCKQGELWIRGPTIMKGYTRDEVATRATLVDGGWLKTGDICYIDEEGYFYMIDRLKEMIKFNGYQVAPAELEQLLHSHPAVIDAAVIPYPDEAAGEIPMAIVVKQPKSNLEESQLIDFVAQQVSPYKKIRKVRFVDSIPKSASGKILRRELKKAFTPPSSTLSRL